MEETVKQTIEKHHLIQKGDGVIVGLSGGADSSALLVVLKSLQEAYNLRLAAVHVNHQLRGEEALRDQHFSQRLCECLDIPFKVVSVDVEAYSKKMGLSFELAGREVRYQAFEDYRKTLGFDKIAVAHHKGDQAETLMLRLIRGTGLEGLSGIRPQRDQTIIRPLLYVSRGEIEAYCQSKGIDILVDHTNLETEYNRNFIRLRLLPLIEERFSVDLTETLSKMATLLAQDSDYFKEEVDRLWLEKVSPCPGGYEIELDVVSNLHPALSSRMIRRLFKEVRGSLTDLSLEHVSQIQNMSLSKTRKEFVYKSVTFTACGGLLRTTTKAPLTDEEPSAKTCPQIIVEEVVDLENMGIKKNNLAIFVDASTLKGSLSLRHRQPKDQFQPWGMKGHKKLQDFLVDQKVPREIRDQIWLLCDEEKILWVYGYRQSESTRVTENTRQILKLSLSEVVSQN